MSQNTSTAVMQRRTEPHDSLDDFPTPPWATRALLERIDARGTCREPAANRGHMVRPLKEKFRRVVASDVHDYGAGFPVVDYLFPRKFARTDWTITNPPFRLARQFIERAFALSDSGVAVIVRTAFLEGIQRYEELFRLNPPSRILQFCERAPMFRGRLDEGGSTATAYCWLVWEMGEEGTRFEWIPACRKRLERPGDYE